MFSKSRLPGKVGAAVALALGVGFSLPAAAYPPLNNGTPLNAGDFITLSNAPGTEGGEFNAQIVGSLPGTDFVTFCLELNEGTGFYGDPLWVKTITTAARNGGIGGGNPDPLDPKTAYLYTQFARGTLAGYDYTNSNGPQGRADSANSLQHVIWYIEQEIAAIPGTDTQALIWYNQAVAANWQNTGTVEVLNIYRYSSHTQQFTIPGQDLLYMPIPEPETYAMLLAGLGLMGFVARRRKQIQSA